MMFATHVSVVSCRRVGFVDAVTEQSSTRYEVQLSNEAVLLLSEPLHVDDQYLFTLKSLETA